MTLHRFEEIIGGRTYEIEVTQAGERWRAQLRRRPGALTAMMPFYAGTPEDASRMLTQWLLLAHQRQAVRKTSPVATSGPAPSVR